MDVAIDIRTVVQGKAALRETLHNEFTTAGVQYATHWRRTPHSGFELHTNSNQVAMTTGAMPLPVYFDADLATEVVYRWLRNLRADRKNLDRFASGSWSLETPSSDGIEITVPSGNTSAIVYIRPCYI